MGFHEIEQTGKKMFEQFPIIKRSAKRVYQLASVATSKEKFKSEGDVVRVSPDDGYEYFYGYYDKSPWDATDRYMICIKVKQAYKSVAPKEPGIVGVIDTQDDNKFIKIGTTHSWNVQQGCMAQWIGPDFESRILYNDCRDGEYCSVVYNFKERKEEKVLPMALYDVARDGSFGLSLDFSRLHRMRPGYGYSNLPEKTKGVLCPDIGCIWKVDIQTGTVEELFRYTDFAAFEPNETMNGAEHKVNHLMISPNGKRFMVLHRWFQKGRKHTRLVTVNIDKTEMYNLSDDVFVSHCYWKNDEEILSFLRKKETGDHYYLMKDKTQNYKMYWPELNTDGHCSYSPDGRFIITDTYPNRKRMASVYLCTEEDNRSRRVARVFSPFKYDNDCRCDLHPRWNRKGDKICIDSVHEGRRGLYVIEIEKQLKDIVFYNIKCPENMPLVSFITPVYNASKTIEKAINSVLDQTNCNCEIVIVDDGSTDATPIILKNYTTNERVKVISQKNSGPGIARNKAIRNSKGIFVAFLDADDYVEPYYVEELEKLYSKTNADIIFNEIEYDDLQCSRLRSTKIYKFSDESRHDFIVRQLSGSFSWGQTKAVKKDLIISTKACFDGHDVGEEAKFTFIVLKNAKRVEFLKKDTYHLMESPQGQHKKGGDDPLKVATEEMKQYMLQNNLLSEYEVGLNNMAYKALSMAVYRCALNYGYFKAVKMMKNKIKAYSNSYSLADIDKNKLATSLKMLLPFYRLNFVTPIYIASKLRNKGS